MAKKKKPKIPSNDRFVDQNGEGFSFWTPPKEKKNAKSKRKGKSR